MSKFKIGKGPRESSGIYNVPTLTHDRYGMMKGGIIVAVVAVVAVLFIPGCVVGIRQIDRHMAGTKCDAIERTLGQEAFMVDFNYFEYDCLTEVDGQLVSAEDYLRLTQIRITDGES